MKRVCRVCLDRVPSKNDVAERHASKLTTKGLCAGSGLKMLLQMDVKQA